MYVNKKVLALLCVALGTTTLSNYGYRLIVSDLQKDVKRTTDLALYCADKLERAEVPYDTFDQMVFKHIAEA